MKPSNAKIFKTILIDALCVLLVTVAFFAWWSARWYRILYGNGAGFDAILYTMRAGLAGVDTGLVTDWLLNAALPATVCAATASLYLLIRQENALSLPLWKKKDGTRFSLRLWPFRTGTAAVLSVLLFVGIVAWAGVKVELPAWIDGQLHPGTLYEEEYTDPDDTEIVFPEQKRNLIYVYLESMETTFLTPEKGGGCDEDLILPLWELANENLNFSHNDAVGGMLPTSRSTWTVASLVAQSAGIPLSIPVVRNTYGRYSGFLPGVTTVYDILHENGYRQALLIGSDAAFGGQDKYFRSHGMDDIYDVCTARAEGLVPADYSDGWWGMEDYLTYEYAKQKLTELAKGDAPFSFTLFTIDTHCVGGNTCPKCKIRHEESYDDVFNCAARQAVEFVAWLREQDFYENTTVVFVGDHFTMDNGYVQRNIDPDCDRRVYNCILNAVPQTEHAKNRQFTQFDLFPTTLTAMGCTVKGGHLGLGTDLFSGEKTLLERFGEAELNHRINQTSYYYEDRFLYNKN